ncbi:arf-like gtpase [Stylonychia lemnae]|uniref:Arf-like gtpase n=1 Tax=Stylonychia lemnae TaxID=5949 RepID=A0A078AQ35_STYLE|nr:arf-like gtpase [Stylonychia lemnae]|eukprot:CDW84081.1 arf-like gtpase [Stylonychia lemnae]
MGMIFTTLWQKLQRKDKEYKIIIVGLHNAGKTTILYKLALNEVIVTQPTIGSNVEEVSHRNVKLQVWDLGGQENLRSAWDAYYQGAEAVIYVVDAADDSQQSLVSKMEFFNLLIHNDLKDAVILVFANKIDLPTAMNAAQITELFSLHEIKNHEWFIQGCCALTGEGLEDGLNWLTSKLSQKHKLKASSTSGKDGAYVTKLPDHDKRAKLTDLTMEDQDPRSSRNGKEIIDLESSQRSIKNKKYYHEEEKQ